ncbi:Ufm1-specific protease 2 like protein [Argiope bruennichi]|uniref:Ufm1-specific protease 2 like protein n=1 Tax=Argiope bruennichi TaxID=94029 RepID=A0A8T0G2E3_ARGBR|nr:Ufm1-specific protease 2 like protein [Argiope bruennichi]
MECQRKILLSYKIKKNLPFANESLGYVVGWETEEETFCMGITASIEHVLLGLEVIGFFCQVQERLGQNELLAICEQKYGSLKLDLENPVVLFLWKEDGDVNIIAKSYSSYYGTLTDLDLSDIDTNPTVLVRARGHVPLILEIASDPDTLKENVELALEKLRTVFQSQMVAFILHGCNYIVHSSQDGSTMKMKELIKLVNENESSENLKIKKNLKKKCPLDFDILLQTSGNAALENNFNHSIVIHCQRREFRCISLSVPLDVIVVGFESTCTDTIYNLLQSAVDRQLSQISQCLLTHVKSLETLLPVPHHFYPDMWEFPVTLIYPSNKTDKELENYRKELHKKLLLPLDRPFLRKLNACDFSIVSPSGHLINPHEGLNSSGVVGGKCAIVYGKYNYHHYMQDHVNDNGWGCAYRSLQTIISWFKYQGYTDRSVPTHTEIQEACREFGDNTNILCSKSGLDSQEGASA